MPAPDFQPHCILGLPPLTAVAEVLERKRGVYSLASQAAEGNDRSTSTGDCLLGLFPVQYDAVIGFDTDELDGYQTDEVSRLFVTENPMRSQTLCGISLIRFEEQWETSPTLFSDIEAKKSAGVYIAEPWVKAAYSLIAKELGPLLILATDMTQPSHGKIVQEAETRLNYFYEDEKSFFSDPDGAIKWKIAVRWPVWESEQTMDQDRIRDLVECWEFDVDTEKYHYFCALLGLQHPLE